MRVRVYVRVCLSVYEGACVRVCVCACVCAARDVGAFDIETDRQTDCWLLFFPRQVDLDKPENQSPKPATEIGTRGGVCMRALKANARTNVSPLSREDFMWLLRENFC